MNDDWHSHLRNLEKSDGACCGAQTSYYVTNLFIKYVFGLCSILPGAMELHAY